MYNKNYYLERGLSTWPVVSSASKWRKNIKPSDSFKRFFIVSFTRCCCKYACVKFFHVTTAFVKSKMKINCVDKGI